MKLVNYHRLVMFVFASMYPKHLDEIYPNHASFIVSKSFSCTLYNLVQQCTICMYVLILNIRGAFYCNISSLLYLAFELVAGKELSTTHRIRDQTCKIFAQNQQKSVQIYAYSFINIFVNTLKCILATPCIGPDNFILSRHWLAVCRVLPPPSPPPPPPGADTGINFRWGFPIYQVVCFQNLA